MLLSRDIKTDEVVAAKLGAGDSVILLRFDSSDTALSFSNKEGLLNSISSRGGEVFLLGLLPNPNDRRSICFNGDWEGDLTDLGVLEVLDGNKTDPGFFADGCAPPAVFAGDKVLVNSLGGGILPWGLDGCLVAALLGSGWCVCTGCAFAGGGKVPEYFAGE